MPRFHFNVYDGVTVLDHEGTELADCQAARLEAIRRSGEVLQNGPQCIALGEDWRMEVTDATGLILFRLDFAVTSSAAMPPKH